MYVLIDFNTLVESFGGKYPTSCHVIADIICYVTLCVVCCVMSDVTLNIISDIMSHAYVDAKLDVLSVVSS